MAGPLVRALPTEAADAARTARAAGQPAVTFRSVTIGLLIVIALSAYVPYQHVLGGAAVEGFYLPIAALLAVGALVIVNAALIRWVPRRRLAAGEFAVVLAMILAACAVTNIGLFRQLPANLVGVWAVAPENVTWRETLAALNLPEWMFPGTTADSAADSAIERAADPVIRDYIGRTALDDRGIANQWRAVPWRAWLAPALSWGALLVCLWGAVLCLVLIFRRQWAENERLPFPIATIYLSLIEPPEPGRAFNRMLRSRSLWIAFAAVFAINALRGLHVYDPRHFPDVPVGYDLRGLLANPPWNWTLWGLQRQESISFTMIAICLFITTRVSFSIWFFYVALNAARMFAGAQYQREITLAMGEDQTMGALLAYGGAALWVARHHLRLVLGQMVRGGARPGEPREPYLPYVVAGWALVAFGGGMVAWLMLAGATPAGAVVITALLLFVFLTITRLVAETGLLFIVFHVSIDRWFVYALQDVTSAMATRTTGQTYFLAALFKGIFFEGLSHNLGPHAAHSVRVADAAGADRRPGGPWRRGAALIGCIALALAVAYIVGGASMLHVEYNHAVTLDRTESLPNPWPTTDMPRWWILAPTTSYLSPGGPPAEAHSRVGHFAFGAFVTAACSALRLRYDWWPLHPVGFLIVYGWGINWIWFSIFLGWLVKVLIVRFGGATMLRGAKPLFIGLILGEAAAAVMWVAVALARLSMGLDYEAIIVR